jgi:hypothetical protein
MLSTEPAYCNWDKYFVITCLKAESMEPQYVRRRELQNPIGGKYGTPIRTVLVLTPFIVFSFSFFLFDVPDFFTLLLFFLLHFMLFVLIQKMFLKVH